MNHAVTIDLKKLRDGMSTEEAASAAGVGRRCWQRWEKKGQIPQGALNRFREKTGRTA